ncbi:MAG: GAF domain-containing protein [Fidelibacterota bacterium]
MNKEQIYHKINKTVKALSGNEGKYELDETGWMAVISWAIKHFFPHFIFVGFYRVTQPDHLTIGPYQGDVLACGTIPFGKGVCGTAAESGEIIIVDDVGQFPGYISCDDKTVSEIVIPIKRNGKVTAVLDIDAKEKGVFDEVDKKNLQNLCIQVFIN